MLHGCTDCAIDGSRVFPSALGGAWKCAQRLRQEQVGRDNLLATITSGVGGLPPEGRGSIYLMNRPLPTTDRGSI